MTLANWVRAPEQRGRELLDGAEPTPDELQLVAERTGYSDEELVYSDLLEGNRESIIEENVEFLASTLEHGGKNQLADVIGVERTAVYNWRKGRQRPTPEHQAALLRYFGLPADLDLGSEPLFLADGPVGEPAMKRWLRERLEVMDRATLQSLFPALQRLFTTP